jgi:hypothetical protein
MPITYSIDRDKQLIHETWTGEIHLKDLAAYWEKYLADPEVLEIRRTIVDLRPATICFSGLDFDALIEDIVLPVLGDRKWLTAIVVGDAVQFGVSRQYQVFAGRYSRDSIFTNVDEAEQWIFTQDCPPVLH